MQIVKLEDIPIQDFLTPKEDLVRLYSTAQQMEMICRSKNGMGLSAAQIGLPWKLFVYWSNYPNQKQQFDCLIDCDYEPVTNSKSISIEGCLSLEGHYKVDRFEEIRVFGKKLDQKNGSLALIDFDSVFSGVISVVMQHEIDHQFGRSKMIDLIGQRIYLS